MVQLEWRTGSLWLLDCSDEQAGREEQPCQVLNPNEVYPHYMDTIV